MIRFNAFLTPLFWLLVLPPWMVSKAKLYTAFSHAHGNALSEVRLCPFTKFPIVVGPVIVVCGTAGSAVGSQGRMKMRNREVMIGTLRCSGILIVLTIRPWRAAIAVVSGTQTDGPCLAFLSRCTIVDSRAARLTITSIVATNRQQIAYFKLVFR